VTLRVIKGNPAATHQVTFKGALEATAEDYAGNAVHYLNQYLVSVHGKSLDDLVLRCDARLSFLTVRRPSPKRRRSGSCGP
jgi:hypothetical protein